MACTLRGDFARGAACVAAAFLWHTTDAEAGRWRYQSPAEPGAYAVGHGSFEIVDPARGGRVIQIDTWYPSDPETAQGSPSFYRILLGVGVTSPIALDDADPSATLAFPLVIYSHGGGGINTEASTLAESLASHGFVVAAPEHLGGDLHSAAEPVEQLRVDRPLDVSRTIDAMLARNLDPGDPLYVHINPARIGVAGYSFGGWTATAMPSGHDEPGVAVVPPDPRVRAIATVARGNGAYQSPDAELEAVDVPALLMAGTLDVSATIDPNTTRPWNLMSGRPLYRADVIGATHSHFSWQCDFAGALLAIGVSEDSLEVLFQNVGGVSYRDTCVDVAIPIAEAQRIRDFYLTAFFERHLLDDGRYDGFLTAGYAQQHEPNVTFLRKDAVPR